MRVPSDRCVCHPLPQLYDCGVCYAAAPAEQLCRHTYAIEQLGSEFLRTHGTRLRKIKELGCDQAVGLRSSSWAAIPYLFVYNGRSNSSLLPNFKVVHHLGPLRGGVICMSGTPTPTSGVGVLLMRKSRACSCAYHVCVCVPMMLIHRHAHMCCCRALSET